MKTDRLQIRMDYIKEKDKPYRNETEGKINYTEEYVKWLEDKVVNNINYTRCCETLKDKVKLTFEEYTEKFYISNGFNYESKRTGKLVDINEITDRYRWYSKYF